MNKKGDNKIGIPWYKRNVKFNGGDDMGINPVSFNLPNIPRPRPRPRTRTSNVREPATQPATQPATNPATQPSLQTNPFQNPLQLPNPFPPLGFPPLGRNPNPAPAPAPAPQKPALPGFPVPAFINNPNYDWAKHFEQVAEGLPEPAPEKQSPAQQVLQNIITPIVGLFAAREIANQYVKINVTDPIYKRMLQDPVLGSVLREGEKANMDAEQLGTILANYDWQNGDYKDLEKTLAAGVGVAGAARLMVFIIGRKVVFRM